MKRKRWVIVYKAYNGQWYVRRCALEEPFEHHFRAEGPYLKWSNAMSHANVIARGWFA